MSVTLNVLAQQLKVTFASILKQNHEATKIRFEKKRLAGHILAISFTYPCDWPQASYPEMNAALLSLHHAGYIFYGANSVTINEKLFESVSVAV
jgi:hypothetical protein